MEHVTLMPGDYVLTDGMTEDQHYAVARALMEAGAGVGESNGYDYYVNQLSFEFFGWNADTCAMDHSGNFEALMTEKGLPCRQLNIEQVLTATNSGNATGRNS